MGAVSQGFPPVPQPVQGVRLCFSIPGEVTDGFLSQIAMFALVLRALPAPWSQARIIAYLGCEPGVTIPPRWQPHLADVECRLFHRPASEAHLIEQARRRFTDVPEACDYVFLCDADTLILGGLDEAVHALAQGAPVAGVIAHFPPPQFSDAEWDAQALALTGRVLARPYVYTLQEPPARYGQPVLRAPFYLNHGFVGFRADALRIFGPQFHQARSAAMGYLKLPIFGGQLALTLTMAHLGWTGAVLPMRYNFPNDPRAVALHRYEAQDIRVLHYLRENYYRRSTLFADPAQFAAYLALEDLPLEEQILQASLMRFTGGEYPF